MLKQFQQPMTLELATYHNHCEWNSCSLQWLHQTSKFSYGLFSCHHTFSISSWLELFSPALYQIVISTATCWSHSLIAHFLIAMNNLFKIISYISSLFSILTVRVLLNVLFQTYESQWIAGTCICRKILKKLLSVAIQIR